MVTQAGLRSADHVIAAVGSSLRYRAGSPNPAWRYQHFDFSMFFLGSRPSDTTVSSVVWLSVYFGQHTTGQRVLWFGGDHCPSVLSPNSALKLSKVFFFPLMLFFWEWWGHHFILTSASIGAYMYSAKNILLFFGEGVCFVILNACCACEEKWKLALLLIRCNAVVVQSSCLN